MTASAQRLIIGANMTTTGVLFRKAEIKAMEGNMRSCALQTVVFPCGNSFFTTCPNAPLWRIPSLTRNNSPTVIIPLLLNPSSISLGVKIPTQRKKTTTVSKTIPGLNLSHINAAIMPINAKSTNMMSMFILYQSVCISFLFCLMSCKCNKNIKVIPTLIT